MIFLWLDVDSKFIIPDHAISGATQRPLLAPRQVSESKLSSVLGKNSWSTVWCLRHQHWNTRYFFSKLNKAATLHYHLEDITPEDVPYHKYTLFIQDPQCFSYSLSQLWISTVTCSLLFQIMAYYCIWPFLYILYTQYPRVVSLLYFIYSTGAVARASNSWQTEPRSAVSNFEQIVASYIAPVYSVVWMSSWL